MSIPPVSSNVHGQLDAQIAQLIQCKPLPEHEVSAPFSHAALARILNRFVAGGVAGVARLSPSNVDRQRPARAGGAFDG